MKKKYLFLGVLFLVFTIISIKKCKNAPEATNFEKIKIKELNEQKKQDSIRIQVLENYINDMNNEIEHLEGINTNSENLLKKMQAKKPKIVYIENVKDCNDTIQAMAFFSTKKDSIFGEILNQKDKIISKKDTVITAKNKQIILFKNELIKNDSLNAFYIKQSIKDTDLILKTQKKKNFWQTTSKILFGGLIFSIFAK